MNLIPKKLKSYKLRFSKKLKSYKLYFPKKLKSYKLQASNGFSLVEVILASAIFVLVMTALVGALLYGQESTVLAGQRTRANMLAEEGLEAVRNIRDQDFSNLTDGAYGLAISNNQWTFSGSEDATDIFTRQIIISTIDSDTKQARAIVSWQQNQQRTGTAELVTYFANWSGSTGSGGCAGHCESLEYATGICRANQNQCARNGETYESGGDAQCTGGGGLDTCCCAL